MTDLQEAKKNAIDFLLKSIEEPYYCIANDNDPLGFEAHLYLTYKGMINKLEWAEKIKKIWDDWVEEREGPPTYDPDGRQLSSRGRYFWPSIDRYCIDVGDPDNADWEPGFDIENHLAMFRAKEVFRLPGYSEWFLRAKRELRGKLGLLQSGTLHNYQEARLIWQIVRSPYLRAALKDSLRATAQRIIEEWKVALYETTMDLVENRRLIVYESLSGLRPADFFFLLTTNLEEDYFPMARDLLEKEIQKQRKDGSFGQGVIETCLNLCSISLSGIDPSGVITNPAISWVIDKQKEDGRWQYLGIDDIIKTDKTKREDVFLTVFVMETLDLITNDKPLPIWVTSVAQPQPIIRPKRDTDNQLNVPRGMKWGDVSITFISEEAVEVRVKNPLGVKNFIELGFKDRRSDRPDTQWQFLKALAKEGGSISWQDKQATSKWKPHIKALRKRLRDLFKIDDDPFFPYRRTSSYKAKFTISFREEN